MMSWPFFLFGRGSSGQWTERLAARIRVCGEKKEGTHNVGGAARNKVLHPEGREGAGPTSALEATNETAASAPPPPPQGVAAEQK